MDKIFYNKVISTMVFQRVKEYKLKKIITFKEYLNKGKKLKAKKKRIAMSMKETINMTNGMVMVN